MSLSYIYIYILIYTRFVFLAVLVLMFAPPLSGARVVPPCAHYRRHLRCQSQQRTGDSGDISQEAFNSSLSIYAMPSADPCT